MGQVRVIVADDHAVVRGRIRSMLDAEPEIEVVDEAANGAEALDRVKTHFPDVLILDLQMPVLNGVEVVQSVREEELPVKVLILSTHADPYFIRSILEYGIDGYVTKDEAHEELVDAVINVAYTENVFVSEKVREVLHH